MKKSLLLFFFTFYLQQSLLAQWSITPKAGINIWKPYFSARPKDFATSTLFMVGLDISYQFSQKWQANIGSFYSQRGNKVVGYPHFDILPTIEYIPNSFLSIYSGFNFGFSNNTNILLPLKNDIGGLLGFKGRYKKLVLHVHYNHSLRPLIALNFTDDIGNILQGKDNLYSQMVQIGLGYAISFKK